MLFTDGNAQDNSTGLVLDTFRLLPAEMLLRVDNNIKVVGALIPNKENTQRIHQLKSIVSEPNDAFDVDFTESNLNRIADLVGNRVRRIVACRGKKFILNHFFN